MTTTTTSVGERAYADSPNERPRTSKVANLAFPILSAAAATRGRWTRSATASGGSATTT